MEETLYQKLSTPEGKMELVMTTARQFGYDKELLYLVSGFMFPERITHEDMISRLKEFRETQYAKLDRLQKDFFLLGFKGYMLIIHEYNEEIRPAIDDVINFMKEEEVLNANKQ